MELREIVYWLKPEQNNPDGTMSLRVTVPVKPLSPYAVMLVVPVWPGITLRDAGLAVI